MEAKQRIKQLQRKNLRKQRILSKQMMKKKRESKTARASEKMKLQSLVKNRQKTTRVT